ncbi:MAG TPA: M56 family metallopeptidase [Candidatus Limnocylindrales bacterium]|nr:M56 family metallopeptidase [Candidatus Limnocylindrales bacterium]
MSHLANWISPDVMRTLGWSLVHFLWQGIALAALLAASMAIFRSAASRYLLGVATMILMLAAPAITFTVLWQTRNAPTPASFAPPSQAALPSVIANRAADLASAAFSTAPTAPRVDALFWFVEIWFAGVIILSLRTAGGVLFIEHLRRKDAKPVGQQLREVCASVQRRLGLDRAIRYCESRLLDAPAVIGWIRPAVLLPVAAITGLSDEQLEAVIAHELAHIRRYDNFVNLFQIIVETLLFYHPAVWWVSKRIRAERENCCDDAAISICGDAAQYARALALMAESRQAPELAMAANRGPLAARVARLLGASNARSGARTAGIAASCVLLIGALAAANAFFGFAHTALASAVPAHAYNFDTPDTSSAQSTSPSSNSSSNPSTARSNSPSSSSSVSTSASTSSSSSSPSVSVSPSTSSESVRATVAVSASQFVSTAAHTATAYAVRVVTDGVAQSQDASSGEAQTASTKGSYIDGMKAAGFDNLTADQLIALKIQGVTPDYVQQLHALGIKPSVDELISLKVQGVSPEYIRDMRAAGVDFDVHKLVAMKVQGISPDYVQQLHALGIDAKTDELIALRVQGVTPGYIKGMRAAGVNFDVNKLVAMRVQGISPDYVQQLHALGIDPKTDELIGLKVQGVTPEYVKEMKAAGVEFNANKLIGMKVQGLDPEYVKAMHDLGISPDANDLIAFRVQGVTPEYIRDMRATGLNPSTNQIIGMRVQDVTPEYVKSLQAAGFKNITVHEVISARIQGVTPEFIEEARKHGFQNLDLQKLIELKNAGVF